MGSSALSLTLLLMSFIHSGLTKALPTSTLTVTPDSPVFTGERVILKCVINSDHSDWKYEWEKDKTDLKGYGNTFTIERAKTSDAGRYTCEGERIGGQESSESNSVYLSVKDLPRPTLTVTPDSLVFTGERVSLKCVINSDHSDWRYEWYKDRTKVSERHTVNRNTLTIERSETSDAGLYTCRGHIDRRSVSSQSSSAVYLSVKERPKALVKVTPDQRVFRGETVTLTCDIQRAGDIQWTYSWFKDASVIRDVTERIYNITSVSDRAEYSCRGERSDSQRSHISAAVTLTVSDLPKTELTVDPKSPLFTGERVSLKCVIVSHSNWRYEWYKGGNNSVMLQTSERYTVNRDTLTIRGATESDQDQFWCRGHRDGRPSSSQKSNQICLAVNDLPRSTLTVTPDSPVFTGATVNLTCDINSDHSNWRYEWYKGSVKLQTSEHYTVNRDTLTISGATESDQDQFWCRGHRDGRPNSSQESERINLSVNVSAASSSLLVTGVVVGLSVCLLLFLSLLLMWRYKKNKDQQRHINQTSVPNQSAQSQLENFPLQSDSDHIYDNVTEVNKRDKDDPEPSADVTYTEVTVKKKMDRGNAKAESNNVTYSEVGKRGKKCKSKDADAGVGDATHALAFWKKGHKKIKMCP